ncbi:hypothetical protein [Enterobacter ludwigii]|uniref:hypothetical protein n=1 Tax=Enterobacter ludwigii TaxID=299767 RepID=UPI003F725BB3
MQFFETYKAIDRHLITLYRAGGDSMEALRLKTRIHCRAATLTLFHEVIRNYMFEKGTFAGLSTREAIIHMLYDDTKLLITDLNQILPSLALKVLAKRISQIDASADYDFARNVLEFSKWNKENRLALSRSPEADLDLPELKWSDFPDEIFALSPGN